MHTVTCDNTLLNNVLSQVTVEFCCHLFTTSESGGPGISIRYAARLLSSYIVGERDFECDAQRVCQVERFLKGSLARTKLNKSATSD